MKTRRLWVFLVVVVWLVSCTAPRSSTSAELRIGVIGTFVQPYDATHGKWMKNALELAVKQINAAGGLDVNGQRYRITLVIEDDQKKPEEAAAAATRLINQQNVVAIVGPLFSGTALAAGQVAENARVPLIAIKATNPNVTADRHYVFRVCFNDRLQGQALARFLRVNQGYSYAGILYDVSDAFNKTLSNSFKESFEQAGGQVLGEETYTTDTTDFSSYVGRFTSPNLQVVFLPDYPVRAQVQVKQLRAGGVQAVFASGDAWDGIDVTIPELEGAYYSTHWVPELTTPASQAFVKTYQEAYGEPPNPVAALSYDALSLIVAAIRAQGKVSPEGITQGLQNLREFNGVTGTISYAQGGDPIKPVLIMRIENGQRVFVTAIQP